MVGTDNQGAGTIFFTGCNLRCVYCQNFQISQQGLGKTYTSDQLVEIMLTLQGQNCAAIDLVSPTVWSRVIVKAISLAKERGLSIPVVWNSNGCEPVSLIKELNGLVDIYLPDFKYSNDDLAKELSNVQDYRQTALSAIGEMYRQVCPLQIKNDVAVKGLIIRHLILPGYLENTCGVLEDIASIGQDNYVSLMSQYFPAYKADQYENLDRRLSRREVELAQTKLLDLNLVNGWTQLPDSASFLLPDFTKEQPFS